MDRGPQELWTQRGRQRWLRSWRRWPHVLPVGSWPRGVCPAQAFPSVEAERAAINLPGGKLQGKPATGENTCVKSRAFQLWLLRTPLPPLVEGGEI